MNAQKQLLLLSNALNAASQQLEKCQEDIAALKSTVSNLKDDFNNCLGPVPTRDPIHNLPDELKVRIFRYLGTPTMVKFRQVSFRWKVFVDNAPELWLELDLVGPFPAYQPIEHAFIEHAMRAARYRTTIVKLCRSEDSDRALSALVRMCPLESITFVQDHDFAMRRTIDIVFQVSCLKRLHFSDCVTRPPGAIYTLLAHHRRQLVDIYIFEVWLSLDRYHTITQEPIAQIHFLKLQSLKITISRSQSFTSAVNGRPELVAARFPALTSLDLSTVRYWTSHGKITLDLRYFSNLEQVRLAWRHVCTVSGLSFDLDVHLPSYMGPLTIESIKSDYGFNVGVKGTATKLDID